MGERIGVDGTAINSVNGAASGSKRKGVSTGAANGGKKSSTRVGDGDDFVFVLNPELDWDDVNVDTRVRMKTLVAETMDIFERKYSKRKVHEWEKKVQKYRPPNSVDGRTYNVPLGNVVRGIQETFYQARGGREASRAGARQVRRCRDRWKAREAKRADDAVAAARAELSVITLPCIPHPSSCTSIDIERFIHPLYATVKGKRRRSILSYIYLHSPNPHRPLLDGVTLTFGDDGSAPRSSSFSAGLDDAGSDSSSAHIFSPPGVSMTPPPLLELFPPP